MAAMYADSWRQKLKNVSGQCKGPILLEVQREQDTGPEALALFISYTKH